MTFIILCVLTVVLPFVVVPNEYECFRAIKENLFQCGTILILAASFFENKLRNYKNKYLMYVLAYCSILFLRFFSMQYIWGGVVRGKKYLSIIDPGALMTTFNVLLGILLDR